MHAWLAATFLLIGDSHTYQSFGRDLDGLLRTLADTRVAAFASWGSSPESWFEGWPTEHGYFAHEPDGTLSDVQAHATPLLAELLARYHPRLTIIALGANLYGASMDYSATVVRKMAQMTAQAGSACLWVGPPDSRARSGPAMDELYGVLRGASVPECAFVDSRKFTHYPDSGGDGLHYDYLGAPGLEQTDRWAHEVFSGVKASLNPASS